MDSLETAATKTPAKLRTAAAESRIVAGTFAVGPRDDRAREHLCAHEAARLGHGRGRRDQCQCSIPGGVGQSRGTSGASPGTKGRGRHRTRRASSTPTRPDARQTPLSFRALQSSAATFRPASTGALVLRATRLLSTHRCFSSRTGISRPRARPRIAEFSVSPTATRMARSPGSSRRRCEGALTAVACRHTQEARYSQQPLTPLTAGQVIAHTGTLCRLFRRPRLRHSRWSERVQDQTLGVDPAICVSLQSEGARSSNRLRQVRKTGSEL
jgi:hypothetical protein